MKSHSARTVLVTGGAGFIGSNLTERLLATPGTRVRLFDNLSRAGVARNLAWLRSKAGPDTLEVVEGDVRDAQAVQRAAVDADEIFHMAAQVAVTTSVEEPAYDFAVNALGTVNVLEAARLSGRKPFVLFTSTNKVYGAMESLQVAPEGTHYRVRDAQFRGVDESTPLDFHSPYGCSKGTADQYVRDYARIYGLPTVVFRMSCIAGPRQFGNEDQGWVAHFLYCALSGRAITIYGDGLQVRDILHVHDLIDAMLLARKAIRVTRGNIYNIGGGLERAVSIREMLQAIERQTGSKLLLNHGGTRPGDQPLYISDTAKMERDTGWRPHRSLADVLADLHTFWRENRLGSVAPVETAAARAAALGVVA